MGVTWSQLFPPEAPLTEYNLPYQHNKVFVVTGGASGVGAALVEILARAGAKVYIAGRSQSDAQNTIDRIRDSIPVYEGSIEFLHVDLADLESVRSAAEELRKRESRIDVLWNNAAVSLPPKGSQSKQGYELMMATNVLGPYLFTKLLLPVLRTTASKDPEASVRVVWTTSQNAELGAPKGGFTMQQIKEPGTDQVFNYNASKIGNWLLCSELARTEKKVLQVCQNPGNLKTNLLRHMPGWQRTLVSPLLHPAKQGAYTELYAGLSPDLVDKNGAYVIPWGRVHPSPREDFVAATKRKEEGGTGLSAELLHWVDEQVQPFV